MLNTYYRSDEQLVLASEGDLREAFWIDLHEPSAEEETRVEQELCMEIPTRDEMREVESSSALYRQGTGTYVTVRLVERGEQGGAGVTSVTLILTAKQLITIRYAEPRSFTQFKIRAQKTSRPAYTPESLFLCALETFVDRDADLLEEVGDTLDPISVKIFSSDTSTSMDKIAATDLSRVLRSIGGAGELASRVRQSLHSISRALPFLHQQFVSDANLSSRLETLRQDVQSLLDHDNFLQTQIQFLLDSNIGLISIQQNAIMKILSVAAVIFLPATLIGSIFGMNFEHMPELHWRFGYPYALGLMLLSAILPLLYFRSRRWF